MPGDRLHARHAIGRRATRTLCTSAGIVSSEQRFAWTSGKVLTWHCTHLSSTVLVPAPVLCANIMIDFTLSWLNTKYGGETKVHGLRGRKLGNGEATVVLPVSGDTSTDQMGQEWRQFGAARRANSTDFHTARSFSLMSWQVNEFTNHALVGPCLDTERKKMMAEGRACTRLPFFVVQVI